jgi:hypothetical protein
MEGALATLIAELEVVNPVTVKNMQVFGLKRSGEGHLAYLTLDEALEKDLVEVTEIDEAGSVPTLRLSNKGERMLFVMSGEQLQGAKQNRVLNVSIMVPSRTDIPIPVSCVEAGRWAYRSLKFGSSGTASHSILRAKMASQVSESYRMQGTPTSKQQAVWGEISRKLGTMGSSSRSSALNQVYQDYESTLKSLIDDVRLPEGCSGAVFAFGGRIVGMDLFDQRATFAKLWPKLVRSYVIDAMEETTESPELTTENIQTWLDAFLTVRSERFRSPGLGEDVRFDSEVQVGSSLLVGNECVHTELFAAPDSR